MIAIQLASLLALHAMTNLGAQARPPGGTMKAASDTTVGVHRYSVTDIDGREVRLSRYRGNVLLLVNVASRCGYTRQYRGLETLYETYRKRGFMVLGFPANNFGGQEPGTNAEIKEFCTATYGVSFDMFSKLSVKGEDQDPLYRYLTSEEANPATKGEIRWNFTKFLVGKDGSVIARFEPSADPTSEEVTAALTAALEK